MFLYIYVYMYVCMYIHIYIYTHIYIYVYCFRAIAGPLADYRLHLLVPRLPRKRLAGLRAFRASELQVIEFHSLLVLV